MTIGGSGRVPQGRRPLVVAVAIAVALAAGAVAVVWLLYARSDVDGSPVDEPAADGAALELEVTAGPADLRAVADVLRRRLTPGDSGIRVRADETRDRIVVTADGELPDEVEQLLIPTGQLRLHRARPGGDGWDLGAPVAQGAVFFSAGAERAPDGSWSVVLDLGDVGVSVVAQQSERAACGEEGRTHLVWTLDGELLSASTPEAACGVAFDRARASVVIASGPSETEADRTARLVRSGELAFPLRVVERRG